VLIDEAQVKPTIVDDYFVVSNAGGSTVQLLSLSGKMLLQQKANSEEFAVSVAGLHLPSGVYLVRLENAGVVSRRMILKK
jgi:hypothetical protein